MSQQKLKVLYVITSLRTGGAERLVVDLALRLKERGHYIDVAVFDTTPTHLTEELDTAGVPVIGFGNGYWQMWNPLHTFHLRKLLKGKDYDIIHSHNSSAQFYTALAKPRNYAAHMFTTEHNTTNRRRGWCWWRFIDRWLYREYDSVVCVSPRVKERLIACLNTNAAKKISVIYNGVDLGRFNKRYVPHMHIGNVGKTVILMVAAFRKQKDHVTVIESMRYLPDNYELWLAGDGENRPKCEKLVQKSGLKDRVKFLGVVSPVQDVIGSAHIMVLSSHYEGMPLSVIEGMAMAKPFVATDAPGLSEIVGGYGLLSEPYNPADLAEKIMSLGKNRKLYDSVSEACYERSKEFDIETVVARYEELYRKLK